MKLKYFFLNIIFVFIIFTASAQSRFSIGPSLSGGYGFSNTSRQTVGLGNFEPITSISYNIGLAVNYKLSDKFRLQSGLLWENQHFNFGYNRVINPEISYINVISGFRANSINVPLLVDFRVLNNSKAQYSLSANLGLNMGFYTNRKDYIDSSKSIKHGADSAFLATKFTAQSKALFNPGLISGLCVRKVLSNGDEAVISLLYILNYREILTGNFEAVQKRNSIFRLEEAPEKFYFASKGSSMQIKFNYLFKL